jgi:small subunit ribosomal protein S20
MPNSPSAIKRMRSDARKAELNKTALSELKTLDNRLRRLADNPEEAKKTALRAVSRYDRAVSRGIIPRGRADRKKSRIAAFIANISQSKSSKK